MSESKVVSFGGGPTGEKVVNKVCVDLLEELLEAARSGEIVGIAGGIQHFDGTTSYRIAGVVGGFSLVGAVSCVRNELSDIARGLVE